MIHKDLHIYNILQRSMKLYMVGVILGCGLNILCILGWFVIVHIHLQRDVLFNQCMESNILIQMSPLFYFNIYLNS